MIREQRWQFQKQRRWAHQQYIPCESCMENAFRFACESFKIKLVILESQQCDFLHSLLVARSRQALPRWRSRCASCSLNATTFPFPYLGFWLPSLFWIIVVLSIAPDLGTFHILRFLSTLEITQPASTRTMRAHPNHNIITWLSFQRRLDLTQSQLSNSIEARTWNAC